MFILIFVFIVYFVSSELEDKQRDYLKKGDDSFSKSNYPEAIKYYGKAIEISPEPRYLYKRAEVYQLTKKFNKAIVDLTRILNVDSDHISSRRLLGKIKLSIGEFEDAEEEFTRILGLRPDNSVAKKLLQKTKTALVRMKSIQDDEDCIRVIPPVVKEFSPESTKLRLRIADCAIRLKRYNLAKPEIHWLLKRDPRDGNVRHLQACNFLYEAMGDVEEGKKGLRKCLEYDPENTKCFKCFKKIKKLEKYLESIQSHKESGRNWKAIRTYEDFLKLANPAQYNYEKVSIDYCNTFKEFPDKKQLAFDSCEKFCPDHPECWIARAEILIDMNNFEESRKLMNKIREETGDVHSGALQQLQEKLKRAEKIANRIDYYKLFDVSKKATTHEIKKAYRKMSLKYHPDKAKSDEERKEFSDKMVTLNQGVEILADEEKRARYDQGDDVKDIFGGRQGGGGGHGFPGGGGFRFNFGGGDFNFGDQFFNFG